MSQKKCYPCDNFDDLIPCNFETEHSKAVKLGMMQEKNQLHVLKLILIINLL